MRRFSAAAAAAALASADCPENKRESESCSEIESKEQYFANVL